MGSNKKGASPLGPPLGGCSGRIGLTIFYNFDLKIIKFIKKWLALLNYQQWSSIAQK
jgi:hypothetical protein